MGEIIGAGLVAHAPTIMMSEADRHELNEGKEISLVPGLRRLKSEVLDVPKPVPYTNLMLPNNSDAQCSVIGTRI